jgi:hypothetical protein
MFVGAKHDRSEYGIITNNLSAVMLRPPQKPDAPKKSIFLLYATSHKIGITDQHRHYTNKVRFRGLNSKN